LNLGIGQNAYFKQKVVYHLNDVDHAFAAQIAQLEQMGYEYIKP